MTPSQETDHFLRRFVVIAVICVSSLIALIVIIATALTPYTDYTAPPVLENWGGLIIGFYFGTFIGLLKDWLSPDKPDPQQLAAAPNTGLEPDPNQAPAPNPALNQTPDPKEKSS